jgi:hypothetical protein
MPRIPRGLTLFNRESLMEIDLVYHPGISTRLINNRVKRSCMDGTPTSLWVRL